MNQTLKDQLIASPSLKSLRDETSLATRFSDMNWHTTVGPTYQDVSTKKLREIDVRATRTWVTNTTPQRYVNITVFCESKTMDGFHVVFADSPSSISPDLIAWAYLIWPGELDHASRAELADTLVRAGLEQDTADSIVEDLQALSHPDGSPLIDDLVIPPIDPIPTATTFKETAIKTEKDMDNSVLWRACHALASVMASYRLSIKKGNNEDFEMVARHGIQNNTFIESLNDIYSRRVSYLTLLYPVVVLDASLWIIDGAELRQVPACRFIQRSAICDDDVWYDVVTREHFDEYTERLTSHFQTKLEVVGCEPIKDLDEI